MIRNEGNPYWPWIDNKRGAWDASGKGCICTPVAVFDQGLDLIAEWTDEMTNPPHIITSANGRTYDLKALETPPCLLPSDVREALEAWPHGWTRLYSSAFAGNPAWKDIERVSADAAIHRARPAPKVTEHVWYWRLGDTAAGSIRDERDTHKITIRHTGDTLPFGTYKLEGSDATFTVEKVE